MCVPSLRGPWRLSGSRFALLRHRNSMINVVLILFAMVHNYVLIVFAMVHNYDGQVCCFFVLLHMFGKSRGTYCRFVEPRASFRMVFGSLLGSKIHINLDFDQFRYGSQLRFDRFRYGSQL